MLYLQLKDRLQLNDTEYLLINLLSGISEVSPLERRVGPVAVDLLRSVDPYDVQVAEVDALVVQESGAGAAFVAHMAPRRRVGGGSGCLRCGRRQH